jgi:predicted nucleic acid-binding protein
MGLIVDTSELVNAERVGGSALDVVALYRSNEKYVISAMTVAELQHGIARADSTGRRLKRERFLFDVLHTFEVCPLIFLSQSAWETSMRI